MRTDNSDIGANGAHTPQNCRRTESAAPQRPSSGAEASTSGRASPGRNTDEPGVPVYVMLPLDTICVKPNPDGTTESVIRNEQDLQMSLVQLKAAGVQVCQLPATAAAQSANCQHRALPPCSGPPVRSLPMSSLQRQLFVAQHAAALSSVRGRRAHPPWVDRLSYNEGI